MPKRVNPYKCSACGKDVGWKGCKAHDCPFKDKNEFYNYGPTDHGRKKPTLDELDGDWPG